jgi:hypothetical protein
MVAMGHSSTWRPSLSVNEVALGCWSQFLCERGHKLQALPQLSVTPDWMRFSSATGVFLPSCGPLVYVTFCVVSTGVVQAVLELAGVLTDLWCLQTVYLHDTHDVGALSDPEALHTLDRSTAFRHVDREV